MGDYTILICQRCCIRWSYTGKFKQAGLDWSLRRSPALCYVHYSLSEDIFKQHDLFDMDFSRLADQRNREYIVNTDSADGFKTCN